MRCPNMPHNTKAVHGDVATTGQANERVAVRNATRTLRRDTDSQHKVQWARASDARQRAEPCGMGDAVSQSTPLCQNQARPDT